MTQDIDATMAGIDIDDPIVISSDSDDDDMPTQYQQLEGSSLKRKAQQAKFSTWVSGRTATYTKEFNKEAEQVEEVDKSLFELHREEAAKMAMDSPREYQIELFERAKQRNTIAVLGTGSGKTLIAILLLRHVLDQEIDRISQGHPHRTAFFIVPSVTLVFQQSSVLKVNLADGEELVTEFWGAMGKDLWNRNVWMKCLAQYKVIVCTPEILCQSLDKGFVRMSQINLLILDEAHHAKASTPYANIVREHYKKAPQEARPRIFGMTASPVDAKTDVVKAARDLEDLLDSIIATTKSGSIGDYVHRAEDRRLSYTVVSKPFETPLYIEMHNRFSKLKNLSKTFVKSKEASKELGAWASDVYWQFELGERGSIRAGAKMRQAHSINGSATTVQDQEARLLADAVTFIQAHNFGVPAASPELLSNKVLALHQELQQHFERPTSNRCLVFVEERTHARILYLIFFAIGGPNLHAGLITATDANSGDAAITLRQQLLTMQKFRRGEINCLFTTQVSEEGLDIPNCNLVIRFDLYKTMIQYIQSRGRARARNSKFIHMHEKYNSQHECLIRDVQRAEQKMQSFCESQSEDRLLRAYDEDLPTEVIVGREYVTPAGAKLNWTNAMTFLGYYVMTLPEIEKGVARKMNYVAGPAGAGQFKCEVLMPEGAPFRSATGQSLRSKGLAKRSAAFEMCMLLLEAKHLDANILPTIKKLRPELANAHLALKGQKGNYPMRLKPEIWSSHHGTILQSLFLAIVDVSDGLQRPYQPLGILTTKPLPALPTFPIFIGESKITHVIIKNLGPVSASRTVIELFTTFTLRIFQDIFIKQFERNESKMSYFMVPVLQPPTQDINPSPNDHIDWAAINRVCQTTDAECRWTPAMSNKQLNDRYIIDPGDGGRRVFSLSVNPELKASDPVPRDCVQRKHQDNIIEYSVSLWKNSRARIEWDMSQPVFEAEMIDLRFDLLAPPDKQKRKKLQAINQRVVLCPQPLVISPLSAKFVTMCLVMPPIIHRIEDYLIALEAVDRFGIKVSAGLALEACTKDADNSEDPMAGQLNFRPGMGPNYERLEFLGDTFLKMATTIALFGHKPKHDEFWSHCERMNLLCNKNLYMTTVEKLQLYEYVRTMAFSRRLWYPEGLKLLDGKGVKRGHEDDAKSEQYRHSLNDKSIADVCEAMIGAAFVEHYQPGNWAPAQWGDAVKAVSAVVGHKNHTMQSWQDYVDNYKLPAYQTLAPTAVQRDLCARVFKSHNYTFRYPPLLASALTHPSLPAVWATAPNYQRLEFLGDSLLDVAFVTHLFYKYPDKDPQWLTEHKGVMVGNRFLATVCVELGLYQHMRQNHPSMVNEINQWVEEIKDAKEKVNGAVDYWTTVKAPHKCLADLVEAYVAAIFIDSNFDYNEVQRFFDQHIKPFFVDMTLYDSFSRDHPINRLCERLSVELGCKDFHLMSEELKLMTPGAKPKIISAVMVHDKVVEGSEGRSSGSKVAKVKAAKACVEALEGLAPFEFRIKYGCDCGLKGVTEAMKPEDVGTAA